MHDLPRVIQTFLSSVTDMVIAIRFASSKLLSAVARVRTTRILTDVFKNKTKLRKYECHMGSNAYKHFCVVAASG